MLGFFCNGDRDFHPKFKFSNKNECYIVSTRDKYNIDHLEYFDAE